MYWYKFIKPITYVRFYIFNKIINIENIWKVAHFVYYLPCFNGFEWILMYFLRSNKIRIFLLDKNT